MFTDVGLAKYDAIAFVLTTGAVLDEDQKAAFQRYIRSGHGFVGVHAATDTFHKWPWYLQLVGAEFKRHPAPHDARIVIEDRAHPSTAFLAWNWTRFDEWYDFVKNPRPDVRVLASLDEKSYPGGQMGDHPIIWEHEFEGGRVWYTELGHPKAAYKETMFMESLGQGILWATQGRRPAEAKDVAFTDLSGYTTTNGVIDNGATRRDILTKQEFGDCLVHVEFKIPKGSNSGVYLQGRYECQILDSFGVANKDLRFSDCGGIYQRWIEKTGEGFEGTPPIRNAFRGPDTWNAYDILFRAPRFNNGKKVEDARFIEVRLNGVVIQNDVAVTGPTRAAHFNDEKATGPLMLQGDHGGVAFRNVWVKPLKL